MEMTQFLEHDLSRMDDLSIDSIKDCLKERYDRDLIYTNISDILIAVNPRKTLPIYDQKTHDRYNADKVEADMEPHIFHVAATAYRRMLQTETNQVIIVSGESGAGKTESTKYMVKHMVHMCQQTDLALHEKIVKINPLLEAFGNARTLMNDNSSRYAKYLEISFKNDGELAGAVVRDYMLEKSRVIGRNDGEGNFHIFYALFAGCPRETLNDLFLLDSPECYRIMESDEQSPISEVDKYRQMYYDSMDILLKLDVNREILQAMLAAVILIADIEFEENDRGAAEIKDFAPYAHAAILLELDETLFGEALITSKRKVRGDEIATYKTVKQANDSRDALAKMLYERVFGWLVRTINRDLHPNRLGSDIKANIGILDIAGFEKLQTNSFEQMCINLVNEKLQSFMNKKIFTLEIQIYKEEGIKLDGIDFKNNDDLLTMFETPVTGILAILDENSSVQHASDAAFVQHLKTKHGDNELFSQPPGDRPFFCIQHFAAMVPYNAEGFIEKNRDNLNYELVQVMRESKDELVSDLFTIKRGPTGTISADSLFPIRKSHRGVKVMVPGKSKLKPTPQGQQLALELGKSLKKRFGTVQKPNKMTQITPNKQHATLVSFFKNSLIKLLEKLGDGNPFFVRCVKANTSLRPDDFDSVVVCDQLKYNGLAEIAKIRKMGFGVRLLYTEFLARYRGLFSRPPSQKQDDITQSLLLLLPARYHRNFRCGKSRLFMTSDLNDWFENLLRCRRRAAAGTVTRCIRRVGEIVAEQKRLEEERMRQERATSTSLKMSRKGMGLGDTLGLRGTAASSTGSSRRESLGDPDNIWKTPLRDTVQPDGRFPEDRPPSPIIHIDEDFEEDHHEHTNEEEKDKHKKKSETQFWDVCQIIKRERKVRDVDEDRGLQVIKVVTYVLLFLILLVCAVFQKLSLMFLVSHQYDRTANRSFTDLADDSKIEAARFYLLTIAIVIPYCLVFLSSIFKWMFGNLPVPGLSTFLLCLVVEIMHSIGLCILAFIVLPELDMVRGILLMNAVAIIPSIIFPVCASDAKVKGDASSYSRGIAVFVLNIVTVLVQFGYILLTLLLDYVVADSTVHTETYNIVLVAVAMIFVSASWWENFVDDRFCGQTSIRGCWRNFMLKAKFELQEGRPVISAITSFIKIGLTVLMAWAIKTYHPENQSDEESNARHIADIGFGEAFDALDEVEYIEKTSVITLTLAAYVGHYVSYTACKLKLQKFSFNVPLILSTPIAVLVALTECSETNTLDTLTKERQTCRRGDDHWYHYAFGAMAWISIYWLCRHVFYPNIERLAKAERLFVNPYYCGILFEQHLILNRRRHTRKVYKEIKSGKVFYRLSEYNSKVTIEGEEEDDVSTNSGKENVNTDGNSEKYTNPRLRDNGNDENTREDVTSEQYTNPKFRDIPMIYACATMWHETKYEMIQLMKSLFRMDRDQCIRREAEIWFNKEDKDFYDFEAHILFDDAMTLNDDEEMVPNDFVKLLMTTMDEAASCVYEKAIKIKPPFKVPTPYGGQLIYTMPGNNFLFVHLKDKSKIRHRKRWSQVMYMYYLLGFRIVRVCQETVTAALNEGKINNLIQWEQGSNQTSGNVGRSQIFHAFDDQVIKKANNTFLLALDGDVDFSPGAVRLLLDRMRKSEKVGAACGRIHPIGTGPVVWFQTFEYAIAHWLQKATEHVLGCVLCSPGCFSMFRGSALMDDNVMKKYTILPTEAAHHLMYDQGEDRWLCTLLLQQGYRVDYAAGSDAFTYAPEGFEEFFNQRRRWMPSTVFNIIDLLADYKNTVYVNSNISMLYILYQGALLLSTVVGPATVLMMIAGANVVVFKVTVIWGYIIALAPAVFYFTLCFYVKPKVQIQIAEILTGLYAFVMMIVLVGTIVTAAQESPLHPSVIFLGFLVVAFTFSAILHPKEWSCIIYGALYFILIPTGFLLLNIYSLCNLNNVSWGTREVPKKKTKEEQEKEKAAAEEKKRKKKERGFFGRFFPTFPTKDLKELITKLTESQSSKKENMGSNETNELLKEMNVHLKELIGQKNKPSTKEEQHEQSGPDSHTTTLNTDEEKQPTEPPKPKLKGILKHPPSSMKASIVRHALISESVRNIDSGKEEDIYDKKFKRQRDDLVNPAWADCKELGTGKIINLAKEELTFWEGFIGKYLQPLDLSEEQKKENAKGLIDLRNNIALGMAMINLLWIAVNFMFQYQSPTSISVKLSSSTDNPDSPEYLEENQADDSDQTADNIVNVDVLGLLFIFFYLAILLLQFVGMIMHRWGTFQHLVAVTRLRNPFPSIEKKSRQSKDIEAQDKEIKAKDARKIIEEMLREPLPDYSDSESDEEEQQKEAQVELEVLQKTGSRYRVTVGQHGIRATSRRLGESIPDIKRSTILGRSLKILNDGLQVSQRKFAFAPDNQNLKKEMQLNYYKSKDKNIDRPLPPIKQRRLNLGPGRSELATRLIEKDARTAKYFKEQEDDGDRPLIPETDAEDDIYDRIGQRGTVSRQLGKRLKLMARSVNTMPRPTVTFQNSGRPTSTHHHLNHYDRYHDYRPYYRT